MANAVYLARFDPGGGLCAALGVGNAYMVGTDQQFQANHRRAYRFLGDHHCQTSRKHSAIDGRNRKQIRFGKMNAAITESSIHRSAIKTIRGIFQ
jgi:hypothetical protein